jgi:hypothetical protein
MKISDFRATHHNTPPLGAGSFIFQKNDVSWSIQKKYGHISPATIIEIRHWRILMSDLSTFEQYYKLADQLIEKMSKEDIAECARLLALNVAHYQFEYGELPLDETLGMISMGKPNDEQIQLMSDGMEVFVGVLGSVASGMELQKH